MISPMPADPAKAAMGSPTAANKIAAGSTGSINSCGSGWGEGRASGWGKGRGDGRTDTIETVRIVRP